MRQIEILVIEDEEKLARTLKDYLVLNQYKVQTYAAAKQGLDYFIWNKQSVDLILLDIMLPDMSGYQVLKEIRAISDVPIIILSAMSSISDQMSGFEKGADDYLTKPFSLQLLKLHIEAILKRAGKLKQRITYKEIEIDLVQQKVYLAGSYMETTKKEYELLLYFMEHEGMILNRNMILDAVWGYSYEGDIRTVDTLVKQLRKKIGDSSGYIHTVYGIGYIFGDEASANGKD